MQIELAGAQPDLRQCDRLGLAPGRYATVTVRDNGKGMDEETLQRIFEPFFTTKQSSGGTGLGLATVYGAVVQMGGQIRVDSVPGRGTKFSLFFPRVVAASEAELPVAKPALPRAVAGETILLMEDEAPVRDVTAKLLRKLGYDVLVTPDGESGVALAADRSQRIDLVFSDIVMPQSISGIELARYIKAHYPEIHIVLTSAYPLATLRREHGELAEFVFVHKPYRLSDVARAIRTFR